MKGVFIMFENLTLKDFTLGNYTVTDVPVAFDTHGYPVLTKGVMTKVQKLVLKASDKNINTISFNEPR